MLVLKSLNDCYPTFSEDEKYRRLNERARKNSTVFVGSKYFNELGIEELIQDSNIEDFCYNRSFEGLSMSNIEEALDSYIYPLEPKKIFLNIGENDENTENFGSKFEFLLLNIHRKCPNCRIYTIGLKEYKKLNPILREKSTENGCTFINLTGGNELEKDYNLIEKYLSPMYHRPSSSKGEYISDSTLYTH